MASLSQPRYTIEEYLALEEREGMRYEYYAGEVYAMAGVTEKHALIEGNIYAALRRQLGVQGSCRPFTSSMRVGVPQFGQYFYPDAFVVCGPSQYSPRIAHAIINPTVVFEVLSPSTEAFDRGRKFRMYKALPSLTDYVLVSQDEALAEHFVRHERQWIINTVDEPSGLIQLSSIGCELRLSDLYEGVDLSSE
jgi:Uma2 family endonuclease